MEKLMQNAASAYMPAFKNMAKSRAQELQQMKSKVKSSPEEVEAWFDKEIQKLDNVDVNDVLDKFNATAGI